MRQMMPIEQDALADRLRAVQSEDRYLRTQQVEQVQLYGDTTVLMRSSLQLWANYDDA
jgi:hypothetical protein